MILFIFCFSSLALLFSFFISQLLPISQDLHQLCLSMAPSTQWQNYYQAIVCGKNLSHENFYSHLQKLGLLHIIVVSGSHLIFLSQWIQKLPKVLSRPLEPFLLILFVLIGQLEAPVLRALISMGAFSLKKRWKLFYSPYQILLLTALLALSLFPEWYLSQSLLLSCGAALGIQLSQNPFLQSFFCYVILTPMLAGFASLSPLTLICNSLLTPLVGYFLFPVSFFAFFLPIESFTDKMWQLFYLCCRGIAQRTDSYSIELPSLGMFYQWIYIFTLHVAIQEFRKRRFV